MNDKPILYGVIGLLLGVVLTGFTAAYAVNNNHGGMMNMMGMHSEASEENMSMDGMVGSLQNKTGDDFDEAFISKMIIHHEGAINMAQLAKDNAKHDEINELADDIIVTQSKEINLMRSWQKDWGYTTAAQPQMMVRD